MDQIIRAIHSDHLPAPPSNAKDLLIVEQLGFPQDIIRFYTEMNGAWIHQVGQFEGGWIIDKQEWKWKILAIDEIKTIPTQMWVESKSALFDTMENWHCIVDVQDGNYLAVDLNHGSKGQIIDVFRETVGQVGYHQIIAGDFEQFLSKLLSEPRCYWLDKEFSNLGYH